MTDVVKRLNRHADIDRKIDEAVRSGRESNIHPFDLALLSTVFRPFAKAVDDQQEAKMPASEVQDAVAALIGNVVIELALRMVPRDNIGEAVLFCNDFMVAIAEAVTQRVGMQFAQQHSQAPSSTKEH